MRALIQFLINNVFYFIFVVLITISIALIVNFNDFQQSIYFNSANSFVGQMHNATKVVTGYFGLNKQNERLSNENSILYERILFLESQLEAKDTTQSKFNLISPEKDYEFLSAKVINNSTRNLHNYITLNKGAKDGVRTDMGVISEQGIVGMVYSVSDNFSVVVSVLNPKIKFSVKFKKNNFIGLLTWNGKDYRFAKLEDIPEHVNVEIGDTIVTTGFRFADFKEGFPENMPVGVIEDFSLDNSSANYNIKVRLFTDFKTLSHVKVIGYNYREEQSTLEKNSLQ
jgi:rod shape-determining protein MreC